MSGAAGGAGRAPARRAKAIVQGRGREHRVVVPLAFEVAARISARPLDAFRNDPTQLANGLGELRRAIGADGIVVACAGGMERASSAALDASAIVANGPVAASLEACRRLRESFGDEAALLAGLTGPATLARQFGADLAAAGAVFGELVKAFCAAGTQLVLVFEDDGAVLDDAWRAAVKTADNIARFHQAGLMGWRLEGLPSPVMQPLAAPSADGLGFIMTDDVVAADADIAVLAAWVAGARGVAA
ncbi:MAG: hypothetical protein AB7Q81_18805 [Gammaproteobacteria bacterium]